MFLFRFSGSFLFRFAERRFLGSFLKEPPRKTRLQAVSRSDRPPRILPWFQLLPFPQMVASIRLPLSAEASHLAADRLHL